MPKNENAKKQWTFYVKGYHGHFGRNLPYKSGPALAAWTHTGDAYEVLKLKPPDWRWPFRNARKLNPCKILLTHLCFMFSYKKTCKQFQDFHLHILTELLSPAYIAIDVQLDHWCVLFTCERLSNPDTALQMLIRRCILEWRNYAPYIWAFLKEFVWQKPKIENENGKEVRSIK